MSYFVSYNFSERGSNGFGFGMTNIKLMKEVKSFKDISLMRDLILTDSNLGSVVILSYQLLNDEGI